MPMPTAVLLSGRGSNFAALLAAIDQGEVDAHIVLVVADREAAGLDLAAARGIPTAIIRRKDFASLADFDAANLAALHQSGAQLVVLAGYLSIVGPALVAAYPHAIINVHPALLPSFGGPGYYGHHVHQAVLDAGCKLSGATVHFVSEQVDAGPIIAQAAVPVCDDDDASALAARVLQQEHLLLPQAVGWFAAGRIAVEGRRVKIAR